MNRFTLTREAERDLEKIKEYLCEKAGASVARKVLRSLRDGMALLSAEPGIGHKREDLTGLPVKFWTVHSYLIVYDAESHPLRIVRILHGMRNVEDFLH